MKKIILVVLLCGTAIQTSFAQTEKGSQNIGVSFGVYTNNSTASGTDYNTGIVTDYKSKNTSYSIAPSYSYFVADKLDIGITAGYSYYNSNYDTYYASAIKQTDQKYTGGIFLRKYILFKDKIGIRTGPIFEYSKNTQKANQTLLSGEQTHFERNYETYSGGVRLDVVYFPIKKIGLAASVGNIYYSHQKAYGNDHGTSDSFQASFVNGLYFSFYYVL